VRKVNIPCSAELAWQPRCQAVSGAWLKNARLTKQIGDVE